MGCLSTRYCTVTEYSIHLHSISLDIYFISLSPFLGIFFT